MENYYASSRHCVICGERLIQQSTSFTPTSQSEKWLYSFRAVLPTESKHGIGLTNPAFFTSIIPDSSVDVDIPGSPDNPPRSITISSADLSSNVAHCFHLPCWRFLKLRRPWVQPIHIYSLATALIPRYNYDAYVNPFKARHAVLYHALEWLVASLSPALDSVSNSEDEESGSLDLPGLLICISKKLPAELISMIWTRLPECPVRSLLFVAAGGSIALLDKLTPCKSESSGYISCDRYITAYMIVIGGQEYMCGLYDGERVCGYRSEKDRTVSIDSTISRVGFVRGRHGIKRLFFHCQDGSVKPLGGICSSSDACNWAGIFSQTAPFIQFWWDGLKLCDMYPMEEGPAPFGERFLWDSGTPISLTNTLPTETFFRHPRQFYTDLSLWSPVRCLPFSGDGQDHLYGITAFCTPNGVTGMGTHFKHTYNGKKTVWIGRQAGCPVHFRLQDTEVITSIWMTHLGLESHFFTTYITLKIKTNKGRTCKFGPALHPEPTSLELLANQEHGRISGLYFLFGLFGKLNVTLSTTSLGVCYFSHEDNNNNNDDDEDDKPEETPENPHIDTPPNSRASFLSQDSAQHSNFQLYSSQATLSDVEEIHVFSNETRSTGMMITHSDGVQDILGQWHEDLPSKHYSMLYKKHPEHDQFREKLYLKLGFTRGRPTFREAALTPFAVDSDDANGFLIKDIDFGDTIIWWFALNLDFISSRH